MDAQGKAVMSVQETDGTGYANVEMRRGIDVQNMPWRQKIIL
jgi:hypothetical protein